LWFGTDATGALVLSQVVLSFGIPFALVPLVVLAGSRTLMGEFANGRLLRILSWVSTVAIVAINAVLVVLLASGAA
jgi:manganese transport protein